jgi:hypothetical protein
MTTVDQSHVSQVDGDMLDVRSGSYAMAYAYTAIFNAILVIFKELIPAVHDFMAAILGHHWITHGVADLIVFFALGIYFTRRGHAISGDTAVNYLIWGTILGGGIIVAFFLFLL